MFFAGLILFFLCVQFLLWYGLAIVSVILGFILHNNSSKHLSLALAAGVAQAGLAFFHDGRHYGLISQRMGGLLSLPNPNFMFAVMFALAFLPVFLWLRAGLFVRQLFGKSTV